MAKSKRAPALFEVIRKDGGTAAGIKIGIPRWWKSLPFSGGQGASPAPSPDLPPEVVVEQPATVPLAIEAEPPIAEPEPSAAPGSVIISLAGWRPEFRFAEGRVEMSLSLVGMVVVAGGLLLALACSYQIGRFVGRSSASAAPVAAASRLDRELDGAAVRQSSPPAPAEPAVKETRPPAPVQAPPGPAVAAQATDPKRPETPPVVEPAKAPSGRVPGLNHIVVERFHTDLPGVSNKQDARQQAEQAQKWLLEKCGLKTVLEPIPNGYRLVTDQMFKLSDPGQKEACSQLQEAILGYGKQFAREGHRYLFKSYVEKIK